MMQREVVERDGWGQIIGWFLLAAFICTLFEIPFMVMIAMTIVFPGMVYFEMQKKELSFSEMIHQARGHVLTLTTCLTGAWIAWIVRPMWTALL